MLETNDQLCKSVTDHTHTHVPAGLAKGSPYRPHKLNHANVALLAATRFGLFSLLPPFDAFQVTQLFDLFSLHLLHPFVQTVCACLRKKTAGLRKSDVSRLFPSETLPHVKGARPLLKQNRGDHGCVLRTPPNKTNAGSPLVFSFQPPRKRVQLQKGPTPSQLTWGRIHVRPPISRVNAPSAKNSPRAR